MAIRWILALFVLSVVLTATNTFGDNDETRIIVYQSPVLLGEIDGQITIARPQDMILTRHTVINGQLNLPGNPIIEHDPEKNPIKIKSPKGTDSMGPSYLVQVRDEAVVQSIQTAITPPEREKPENPTADFHYRRLVLKDGKVMREARSAGTAPPSQPGGRYVWETLEPGDHPGIHVLKDGNAILKGDPNRSPAVFVIDGLEIGSDQQLLAAMPTTLHVREDATIQGELGQSSDPHAFSIVGTRSDIVLSAGGKVWSDKTHIPRGAILVGDSCVLNGHLILTDHLILTPGSQVICRKH